MDIILLSKILATMVTVVGLALIAERVSTKTAGLLAGFPLGTAIALFFIGLEQSPEFASESAHYTLLGFISAQCLAATYYIASLYFPNQRPIAVLSSVIMFVIVSGQLNALTVSLPIALLLSIVSTLLFHKLLAHIPEKQIDRPLKNGFRVLLFRASLSTAILLLITNIAHWSGPQWAGVLAAFPITFFPLLLIIHFNYSNKPAHTLIKHYPAGLGALICYTTVLSVSYPTLGLVWGTLVSFASALTYLLILSRIRTIR